MPAMLLWHNLYFVALETIRAQEEAVSRRPRLKNFSAPRLHVIASTSSGDVDADAAVSRLFRAANPELPEPARVWSNFTHRDRGAQLHHLHVWEEIAEGRDGGSEFLKVDDMQVGQRFPNLRLVLDVDDSESRFVDFEGPQHAGVTATTDEIKRGENNVEARTAPILGIPIHPDIFKMAREPNFFARLPDPDFVSCSRSDLVLSSDALLKMFMQSRFFEGAAVGATSGRRLGAPEKRGWDGRAQQVPFEIDDVRLDRLLFFGSQTTRSRGSGSATRTGGLACYLISVAGAKKLLHAVAAGGWVSSVRSALLGEEAAEELTGISKKCSGAPLPGVPWVEEYNYGVQECQQDQTQVGRSFRTHAWPPDADPQRSATPEREALPFVFRRNRDSPGSGEANETHGRGKEEQVDDEDEQNDSAPKLAEHFRELYPHVNETRVLEWLPYKFPFLVSEESWVGGMKQDTLQNRLSHIFLYDTLDHGDEAKFEPYVTLPALAYNTF